MREFGAKRLAAIERVAVAQQTTPGDRMYAYQADKVVETGKTLLQHLETRLSSDGYEYMQQFVTELTGYIKESDDDRLLLENKIAKLETTLLNLKEARNVALGWLAAFLMFQAYQTGKYLEVAAVGALMYLSLKLYEYYVRRQHRKLAERADQVQ